MIAPSGRDDLRSFLSMLGDEQEKKRFAMAVNRLWPGLDPERVDNLISEGFLRLLKWESKHRRFKSFEQFRQFAHKCVRTATIDEMRRSRRRQKYLPSISGVRIDSLKSRAGRPEQLAEMRHMLRMVRSAVRDWRDPAGRFHVLKLRFDDGLSFRQIAARLRIHDKATARRRYVEMLDALKRDIALALSTGSADATAETAPRLGRGA